VRASPPEPWGDLGPEARRPPLVIGCGALAVELVALTRRAGLPAVDLTCLPASLHNRPERIPAAVRARIRRARADGYDQLFVAYADCGTGGLLDVVLEEEGVARLEGAHCYEVYAGREAFARLHDDEPGTFYLTDFLVRNFDRLVIRGLGLDRHPELLPIYFGNYRRLVYLAQTDDLAMTRAAERAAAQLGGLAFERRFTGLGELDAALRPAAAARAGGAVADADPVARPSFDSLSELLVQEGVEHDSKARTEAFAPDPLTDSQKSARNRGQEAGRQRVRPEILTISQCARPSPLRPRISPLRQRIPRKAHRADGTHAAPVAGMSA
jgi:Protein of unknown function (DUF1638)